MRPVKAQSAFFLIYRVTETVTGMSMFKMDSYPVSCWKQTRCSTPS